MTGQDQVAPPLPGVGEWEIAHDEQHPAEPGDSSEGPRRYRIRRSSGDYQFVTQAELDELNLERKVRDQQRDQTLRRRNDLVLVVAAIPLALIALLVADVLMAPPGGEADTNPMVLEQGSAAGDPAAPSAGPAPSGAVAGSQEGATARSPGAIEPRTEASPGGAAGASGADSSVASSEGRSRATDAARTAAVSDAGIVAVEATARGPQAEAPTAALPGRQAPALARVERALERWRGHWQAGDVEGYLASYGPEFTRSGLSHEDWKRGRRVRLARAEQIRIRISSLELRQRDDGSVLAAFLQRYRDSRYTDESLKALVFELIDGSWRIVAEIDLVIGR